MRTFAPSFGTISGTRGCALYHRSNSELGLAAAVCAIEAEMAFSAATLSRADSTTADAAAAVKSTMTAIACGLTSRARALRRKRRGKVVIGNVVAAPEMMNSPTIATSAVRQSVFFKQKTAYEMYARYSTT